MDCPDCGVDLVRFSVPSVAAEAAPGAVSAICPSCLALVAAEAPDRPPEFSRIIEAFPSGEAGAVLAVAVGLLVESLTLNRRTVTAFLEHVQGLGVDPWLVIERLAVAPTIDADTDLDRARRQLQQLLEE